MRCPFCQNPDTQVIDSRAPEEGYAIRRRRKCPACGKRFTTFERAHLPIPAVVKRNGQRTDYNRAKLQASMTLALRKRPVTPEQLEEAVDSVEQAMIMLGDREIESSVVGELVLGALQKLDTIAYIRFASVYFNIGDPLAFASMIQNAAVPDGSTDGAFDVLRKFRLEHEAEVAAREAKKKAAAERRARRDAAQAFSAQSCGRRRHREGRPGDRPGLHAADGRSARRGDGSEGCRRAWRKR